MPRHALTVCSADGCTSLTERGRCDDCKRDAEQQRGTSRQRGYGTSHARKFRRGVLRRDRACVRCGTAPSTVADHWPRSRRELVAAGADPDDPQYGRGLCASCHGSETAVNQPGGWHR